MSVYLVTGGSGVVGSGIIAELLSRTDAKILVLLRAKKEQALEVRFEDLKRFWRAHYPEIQAVDLATRVQPIGGEITEPRLGISDSDRAILVATCTHIIHCAASVRMNLPVKHAKLRYFRSRALSNWARLAASFVKRSSSARWVWAGAGRDLCPSAGSLSRMSFTILTNPRKLPRKTS